MFKWEVKPLEEINGIKFGMNREIVRNIIKTEFKEFKKSKFSKNTSDDFGFCHVFYNSSNEFIAIEFFKDIGLTINGKTIFPIFVSEIKSIFPDLEKDNNQYISKINSIGISTENEKVESILFGIEGYYTK